MNRHCNEDPALSGRDTAQKPPAPRERSGLVANLARRSGFALGTRWGNGLLAGVFFLLLARSSPDIFGLFSLAAALGAVVVMAVEAGFLNYLVPRFAEKRARSRRILTQALLLQGALLCASIPILLLVCLARGYAPQKIFVIGLIAIGLGLKAIAQPFFVLCRVKGRQDTEMRLAVSAGLLGSAFGIACLLFRAPLSFLACFQFVEGVTLILLISAALRWRWGALPRGVPDWVRQWRPALTFAGIGLCSLVYTNLSIYFLDQYSGLYALGLFSVPKEMVDGFYTLVANVLLAKVFFPHMSALWHADKAGLLRQTGTAGMVLLLAGLLICYALFVEGDRLLVLLYGEAYARSVPLLNAQLPCIPASFLQSLMTYLLISMRHEKIVLWAYISGALCNIALCCLLIPGYGALGAAWAMSGTRVWMAAVTCGLAAHHGFARGPAGLLAAAAAAGLAWGLHAISLPLLPRELAELLGILPLLALTVFRLAPLLAAARE